jgi:hypothetical protein
MKTLELQGTTTAERNEWLRNLLARGTYDVTFTKVNGESRTMPCTLQKDKLPPAPVRESTREAKVDSMSVWCVDKQEWRSFRVMNVTEVRAL